MRLILRLNPFVYNVIVFLTSDRSPISQISNDSSHLFSAFYRKNSTSYHRNRFTYLPTGSCLFPLVLHNLCTVMWINHCGQMLITWRDFHLMPNPQTVVAHIEYFLLLQASMLYPYIPRVSF